MYTFRSVFFRIKNGELGHGRRQNYLQRSTLRKIQIRALTDTSRLHILSSCSYDNQDWPDSETYSIEHSFSILRRVKTWNRSTMEDEKLSELCMLSVHRKRVQEDTEFIDKRIWTVIKTTFYSIIDFSKIDFQKFYYNC